MNENLNLAHHTVAVAIIDDDTFVREGMVTVLGRFDEFSVVASGASLETTVVADKRPDIVLVASHLIDPSNPILGASPGVWRPRVIVTGVTANQDNLLSLIRAGVMGFVVKDALFFELLAAIRTVASGTQVIPSRLYATVARNVARENIETVPPSAITTPRYVREERPTRQ